MVSAPDSGSRGPGSNLYRGHCVVFLGKTLYFYTVPLFTQEYKWVPLNCQGNLTKCWGTTCEGLASHLGGVAILLVALCYRSRD